MSTFRKINNWLHLWLGLISGIIVFVVCITGCIWVFQEEITELLSPELTIQQEQKAVLRPSQLMEIAQASHPEMKLGYATYQQGRAIHLSLGERRGPGASMEIHPYTGAVLTQNLAGEGDTKFFRWILNGHRFLWLPVEIGRPIVNYGTLVFVFLLISGLIWWYPRKWSKSTRDKSFKIKWGASFKRVNLDLHNVLGFYSLLFLLAIALTGMVYGISWYSKGLYWATSGGQSLPERNREMSDTLEVNRHYSPAEAADLAWNTVSQRHPEATGFYYTFPDPKRPKASFNVTIYPDKGQFYRSRSYAFDQHTLKELPGNEVYGVSFEEASVGAKIRKMNYDIHVGSILGFPGKVLAFLASLIGASLPVTGFIVWWNRKGFGKKKGQHSKRSKANSVQVSEGSLEKGSVFKPKPITKRKPYLVSNHEIGK